MVLHGLFKPFHVKNVAQDRDIWGLGKLFREFYLQVEELVFHPFEKDQFSRLNPEDLATELPSDGARSPRDHHLFVGQIIPYLSPIQFYMLTAEKILDADLPYLPHSDRSVQDVTHGGKGSHSHTCTLTLGNDPAHLLSRQRGNGNDDLLNLLF